VVLAKRRSSRRVVRTLAELEDQTSVGEVLVRQLVRVQLILSIRLMLLTAIVLVGIPLMFLLIPSLSTVTILNLRLPWLLLGLVIYPFFIAVAWSYNRSADRNEQDFAEMVEN
jgi:membrane protein YdbS with pleckstrin-like domain